MDKMNRPAADIHALALELEGGDRAAFLTEACGGDVKLRDEVEAMLVDAVFGGNLSETDRFSTSLGAGRSKLSLVLQHATKLQAMSAFAMATAVMSWLLDANDIAVSARVKIMPP